MSASLSSGQLGLATLTKTAIEIGYVSQGSCSIPVTRVSNSDATCISLSGPSNCLEMCSNTSSKNFPSAKLGVRVLLVSILELQSSGCICKFAEKASLQGLKLHVEAELVKAKAQRLRSQHARLQKRLKSKDVQPSSYKEWIQEFGLPLDDEPRRRESESEV